ncbi:MAG TPA: helix-turn-helix domain-containing protein [Guyparkeria sp.]|nr:helix-turn-helix domain-containing protein [Guyparkeria sp.]
MMTPSEIWSVTMYLSDKQVAERYAVSRPTVWRWTAEGKLPKPIRLSPGCTRWRLDMLQGFEKNLQQNAACIE